jgi:hypothetical protein
MLLVAGCDVAGVGELEWGIGDKADGLCDPAAPLCWTSADLDAVARLDLSRETYAGGGDQQAAAEARAALRALGHKLEPAELDAVESAGDWPALAEVGARLVDSRLAAHAVGLGRALEAQAVGKGDEVDGESPDPEVGGAAASLERLKRENAAGRVYGTLIELSRAHRGDYRVIDRDRFEPVGLSREALVDRALTRKKIEAGLVGVGSGLVSLGGGAILAIPAEAAGVFALHARLAFEISSIYGWDINEGDNLFVVATLLLTEGELEGFDDDLAAAPTLPALMRALGRELGLPITSTLATRLTAKAIAFGVKLLARKAAALLGSAAARELGKAAAEQVLHWASLGLGVIASGVANVYITDKVGDHVAVLTRPWLIDLPIEGSDHLDTPAARSCYASALGAVAAADGEISAREQDMFEVLLDKPYDLGDGRWIHLGPVETEALRADFAAGAEVVCLDRFEDLDARRKLIALSHLYGMAVIDRQLDPRELAAYEPARDLLDGSGWFDGPEINPLHVQFVERAVARAVTSEYDLLEW